jgi:hypothetical protein
MQGLHGDAPSVVLDRAWRTKHVIACHVFSASEERPFGIGLTHAIGSCETLL